MNHTKELIERAHRGDEKARETLVLENMGLIGSIVRRFAGRGYEQEDLFQIGSIGLIKAVDKFDTAFDVKFSTYAVPMRQKLPVSYQRKHQKQQRKRQQSNPL